MKNLFGSKVCMPYRSPICCGGRLGSWHMISFIFTEPGWVCTMHQDACFGNISASKIYMENEKNSGDFFYSYWRLSKLFSIMVIAKELYRNGSLTTLCYVRTPWALLGYFLFLLVGCSLLRESLLVGRSLLREWRDRSDCGSAGLADSAQIWAGYSNKVVTAIPT